MPIFSGDSEDGNVFADSLSFFFLSLSLSFDSRNVTRICRKAEKFADIFRSVVDIHITHPCSRTLKRCLSKTLQRPREGERERVKERERERERC